MKMWVTVLVLFPTLLVRGNEIADRANCGTYETSCGWGCCPLYNAVCCLDGLFCCPAGSTCIPFVGLCVGVSEGYNGSHVPVVTKSEVIRQKDLRDQTCRGGFSCSGDQSCCETGCCPEENAVCCNDGIHCCPADTSCDLQHERCVKNSGGFLYSLSRKRHNFSQFMKSRFQPCEGGFTCPDDNTCCDTGCCSFPNAVCCSDGVSCCPVNTTCDLQQKRCVGKGNELQFLTKVGKGFPKMAIVSANISKEINKVKVVYCPGGTTYCPDYNTCCILPNGQWGCCPFPSAMCCLDKIHCCPLGSRCDITSLHCLHGTDVVPSKLKSQSLPVDSNNIV